MMIGRQASGLLIAFLLVASFLPIIAVASEPVQAQVENSPSVVGTSTSGYATYYPFQRKGFYASGRFWVFYVTGGNIVYRTSADGSSWSAENAVRASTRGERFSTWFDGTYLHYAYAYVTSIYYRRGTPNADGTITWSADEQTVLTIYNKARYPSVCVDTSGYVWVGYMEYTGSVYYPYVIKSGDNDGTWGTTPGDFPYQLSTDAWSSWIVTVVPLTGGKMYAVYSFTAGTGSGRLWDGSSWGGVEHPISGAEVGYGHSVVTQGDDVHIVFLHAISTTGIRYNKRTYGVGWGTESTVQSNADGYMLPALSIDQSSGELYCFYSTKTTGTPPDHTAEHIYYKVYDGANWGDPVDWIDESTEVLNYNDRLTCFYQAYGDYVGLVYMTKTASPYNVKFDSIPPVVPPNVAPEILTSFTPATVDPNTAFDVEIEVRDNDEISDIEEVWLVVYENIKSQGDADNARNHYTFKWVRAGADNWFEVGPDGTPPYDHLVVASCTAGDDAKTTDNFLFNIKLGKIASPNNSWNVWAKVVDNAGEQDNQEFTNKFDVSEYTSLSIDTPTLTFTGAPGDTDLPSSPAKTICTVTSNYTFDIEVRLSADWSGSAYGGSIPMASTHSDKDGISPWDLNLSSILQTLWSSVGWGEDVQRDCYWFLDFPLPLRDDVYSTTFYVRVVKS